MDNTQTTESSGGGGGDSMEEAATTNNKSSSIIKKKEKQILNNTNNNRSRSHSDNCCGPPKRVSSSRQSLSEFVKQHTRCPPLVLHFLMYWNVAVPPVKKYVVNGRLVDNFKFNSSSRSCVERRITIELYRPKQDGNKNSDYGGIEDLTNDDVVVIRIMKSRMVRRPSDYPGSCAVVVPTKMITNDDDDDDVNDDDDVKDDVVEDDVVALAEHIDLVKEQNKVERQEDRNWESKSMFDHTMSWMVNLDEERMRMIRRTLFAA